MQPLPIKYLTHKGIYIGFLVNILVVLLLGLVVLKRSQNQKFMKQEELRKNEILYLLEKLQAASYRIQNMAKGFAISSNEHYLDRLRRKSFEADKNLQTLQTVLKGDVEKLKQLAALEVLIDEKIRIHNQLMEYSRYRSFETAKQAFPTARDLEINDEIDAAVNGMTSSLELKYLHDKVISDIADRRYRVLFTVLWSLSLLLLIAVLFILLNYLRQRNQAEKLLMGSRQLLQSIIDNTTNSVFVKDLGGQYILANQQFNSNFRHRFESVTGKTDHQLFDAEAADRMRSADLDVVKAGRELRFEEDLSQDDETRTYIVVKFPIRDAQNNIYAIGGIATDISEHKRNEVQLIENESVIQAIFDSAPEAVVMVDDKGTINKWNKKAEQLFEYSAQEVLGKSVYEILIPDKLRQSHLSTMKKFLERCNELMVSRSLELTVINKRREEIEVELSLSSNRIKDQCMIIGFIKDIRERKNLEKENRRTKDFLDSIIDNIPDMVFVKEAKELRFVRLNKAGEKLLGYKREELLGKNDHDFFPREQADFFTKVDRRTLEKGGMQDIPEEVIDTKNGKRWLHTKKITISDEHGRPLYLLGISADISKRKSLEDERDLAMKELRESQNRMEMILENIGEGVVVSDTSHNVLLYNQMAGEILKPKEQANFTDWTRQYNIYHSDGKTVFPAQNLPAEKALRGELTNDQEIVLEDLATKKRKRLLVTARPVRNQNNRIIAAVTTFKDITRFKEMERALHESEMKYRNLIGFRRDSAVKEEADRDDPPSED